VDNATTESARHGAHQHNPSAASERAVAEPADTSADHVRITALAHLLRRHEDRVAVVPDKTANKNLGSEGVAGGGSHAAARDTVRTPRFLTPSSEQALLQGPAMGNGIDQFIDPDSLEQDDSEAPGTPATSDARSPERSETPPTDREEEQELPVPDVPELVLEDFSGDIASLDQGVRSFLQTIQDLGGQLARSRTALVLTPVVTATLATVLYSAKRRRCRPGHTGTGMNTCSDALGVPE